MPSRPGPFVPDILGFGQADYDNVVHHYRLLHVAPGLRYHPAGARRRADVALGVELVTGALFLKQEANYQQSGAVIGVNTTRETSLLIAPRFDVGVNFRWPNGLLVGFCAAASPVLSGAFGSTPYTPRQGPRRAFMQLDYAPERLPLMRTHSVPTRPEPIGNAGSRQAGPYYH